MPTRLIRELLVFFTFANVLLFVHLIILIHVLLLRQFCKTKKQTTQHEIASHVQFIGTSIVLLRLNNCHSCLCLAKYVTDSLICLARSCYQNFASTLFKNELQCGAPIVGLMTLP